MKKDEKQKQVETENIEFEEILEGFLNVKPPEKKRAVKKPKATDKGGSGKNGS